MSDKIVIVKDTKEPKVAEEVFWGTGRRKTATARVRISLGSGKIQINDRSFEDYCYHEYLRRAVQAPLVTVDMVDRVDIKVRVAGSGPCGQAVAIAHGVARALQTMNADLRIPLKKAGHLTRDPRKRERKKPGQPGARKRFQFSKR